MTFCYSTNTPIGTITLYERNHKLVRAQWEEHPIEGTYHKTKLMAKAEQEIKAYFERKTTNIELPYEIKGTQFEMDVWNAIARIPYGTTISYRELAIRCGHGKAYRAVGTACRKNPLLFVLPCHRIIKADGSIGEYSCGKERKQKLIDFEANRIL